MMNSFNNIEEILVFAMQSEQDAVDLYTRLADQSDNDEMRETFLQFAKEEMGHKARLTKIRDEGIFEGRSGAVTDMKISDYLAEIKPAENMDYRDALVLAMSNEKAAFRLYSRLAQEAATQEIKDVFNTLAMEEARHKLRFELEYDEFVLRDN
jgi:rubrerythrin